jgi:transcriptional regulator with XRE-family HTH domain
MRRIRALAVEGWSPAIVAARMGTEPSHIRTIARGERTYVTALTARSIAMIYDEWYAEPGPSKLGIAHARKQRWHGPEAWNDDTIDDPCASPIRPRRPRDPDRDVDEVAVHRALSGDHSVHLNRPERSEAVRIAALRGYPPEETARRLGVTERTVERWRAAHRREQVAAA